MHAMPSGHCGEKGLECHSSREGTLSPGVAELEKTEDRQRHCQEPARPAPQLSKLKEFQNCIEPHWVGTFKVCGPVLSAATGRRVTPRWREPRAQRKDQSTTDQLHSGDGKTAEGTGTVAPVSWADRYVEKQVLEVLITAGVLSGLTLGIEREAEKCVVKGTADQAFYFWLLAGISCSTCPVTTHVEYLHLNRWCPVLVHTAHKQAFWKKRDKRSVCSKNGLWESTRKGEK